MSSASTKRRTGKSLSAAFVRTIREPGKYHDGGGLGLILRVELSGSRRWVQRVVISGRRREIGLGTPPVVTLAAAREAALENKRIAQAGDDPITLRRNARTFMTFATAAEQAIAAKSSEFRSDKHRKQWRSTLDTYALPTLGSLPVGQVSTADVLRVLQPIWTEKTETASRLRGRIEAILSWATAAGHREGENAARWKGNLSEMLPKPQRVAKTVHHPALASSDASAWYAALRGRNGTAARAVEFLALTVARSGEVRGMTWAEVDLKAGVWTVPADRMKARREHRVPLSAPALSLLERMAHALDVDPTDGVCPVFPAPRGGFLSDMSLSAVMRRMHESDVKAGRTGWLDRTSGRPAVPHGLRSTFRDWTAERGYLRDMAEMALAHDVGRAVECAYRRSDMLERRRAMMVAWADFLDGGAASGDVVQLTAVGENRHGTARAAAEKIEKWPFSPPPLDEAGAAYKLKAELVEVLVKAGGGSLAHALARARWPFLWDGPSERWKPDQLNAQDEALREAVELWLKTHARNLEWTLALLGARSNNRRDEMKAARNAYESAAGHVRRWVANPADVTLTDRAAAAVEALPLARDISRQTPLRFVRNDVTGAKIRDAAALTRGGVAGVPDWIRSSADDFGRVARDIDEWLRENSAKGGANLASRAVAAFVAQFFDDARQAPQEIDVSNKDLPIVVFADDDQHNPRN